MEKNNKKNKGLIVLIIIVIIILLIIISCLLLNKDLLNTNNNEKTTTVSTTTTTTRNIINNSDEDYNIIDSIHIDTIIDDIDIRNMFALLTNINTFCRGYYFDFSNKKVLYSSDLSSLEKSNMVFTSLILKNLVYKSQYKYEGDIGRYLIKKDDFINESNKLFGNNFELLSEFAYRNSDVVLDDNQYILNFYATGNEGFYEEYLLLDSNKTDDKIELNVLYYYSEVDYDNRKLNIYKTTKDKTIVSSIDYDENYSEESEHELAIKNKSKLTNYKFSFKKDSDHYVFDKIEMINY